ncbi:hypothetical protein SDC9_16382 [bioreactor metagenome]|uniref:Uncharacterized protein n=1 Tax=bioreactor metagenome TaxID=1076179 RepID=A0A644TUI8_9ZZZZ
MFRRIKYTDSSGEWASRIPGSRREAKGETTDCRVAAAGGKKALREGAPGCDGYDERGAARRTIDLGARA